MKVEELKKRILLKNNTNQEWLKLRKEVQDFLQSDASEKDKNNLMGYSEQLVMICKGIESTVK